MDDIDLRILVVNRVDEVLSELLANKAEKKAKSAIETALSSDSVEYFLYRRVEKAIEEMCNENVRSNLVDVIRRYVRPQIIYVNERSKIPRQLEPFHVQEATIAPTGPCIYFLCSDDRIVYIGQTTNLGIRIGEHIQSKKFDRVFFFNVQEADINAVESALIDYYCPELNKAGIKNERRENHEERQRR